MQSDRLKDEIFGGFAVCDHLPCRTCLYAYAGDPENSYCKIYTEEIGLKPHEVYFFGKKCKYYQSQEDLNRAIAALNKNKP